MKKTILTIFAITIVLVLAACTKPTDIKHIVSFETNGGSLVASQEVTQGSFATKPIDPTKENYKFENWYHESTFETVFIFTEVLITKETMVYANWEEDLEEPSDVYYNVTYNVNGGSTVNPEEVLKDSLATKPANPTKIGYIFVNWYHEATFDTVFLFNEVAITKDIVLFAKWEADSNVDMIVKKLYTLDFGTSNKTGYASPTITFQNDNDNKSYTLNKLYGQINSSGGATPYVATPGFVFATIETNTQSYLELDLSEVLPTKIEFFLQAWSAAVYKNIEKNNSLTLTLQAFNNGIWEDLVDSDGNTNLNTLIEDGKQVYVSFDVTYSTKYRIFVNNPNVTGTGNTANALVVDDISVYHSIPAAGEKLLITMDEGYAGSDKQDFEVTYKDKLDEPEDPTREHYSFEGWYLGNDLYDFNSEVKGEFVLTARWNLIEYIVKYDYGHIESNNLETVILGVDQVLNSIEDPTREGYIFKGWYQVVFNADNNELFEFGKLLDSDIRLIAKWQKVKDNPTYIRDDSKLGDYYNTISGKTSKELFDELRSIITNTHTNKLKYSQVQSVLEQSDVHPFSETDVLTIYDRNNVNRYWTDRLWDKEHVWPNSRLGVARASETPNQATDAHNLRAINSTVNTRRGNRNFDISNHLTPVGHVINVGDTSSAYYPGDEDAGDIARIYLYMATRYGDLNLTNQTSLLNLPSSDSYAPSGAYAGMLNVLLSWHLLDPVDDFEINRNNVIAGVQGNRNPFIDHPELFEDVFNYLTILDSNRV